MGNVSRMSGSAWHVDVLKSKDKRRDKRKCKFYDRENKICKYKYSGNFMLPCTSSMRCVGYSEGKSNHNKKTKMEIVKEKTSNTTYVNLENAEKNFKPIEKKKSVKGIALIGDNVEIESLDGKIKKTFRLLDKDKNGKYNAITNACKEKHLNDVIKYKNKEYRIIKIERIKK